jgi:hypothetical protein
MAPDADQSDSGVPGDAVSSRTSRRRFLGAFTKAGVGVGMARALDPSDFDVAAAGDVPIVYAYARRDPSDPGSLEPRTKTVPGEWYAAVERAFAARETLLETGVGDLVGAFVAPGALDDATAAVTLDATTRGVRERIDDLLADLDLPDVTVDVNVFDSLLAGRDADDLGPPRYVDDLDDPRVPSGVYCGSGGHGGTLAPAVYDRDGSPFFATSNHLYGAGGTKRTRHRSDPLYLEGPEERRRIGDVRRGFPNEDVVRVEPVAGYAPTSTIADDPRPVAGQFTRWGLADLQARGEPLTKAGAMSGRTVGEIKGVDGITCYVGDVCKGGQLKWGTEDAMTDGDSGSVAVHPDPEDPGQVLVAGFNNARTWWPGGNYTWGTAAYHVRERYGFHF